MAGLRRCDGGGFNDMVHLAIKPAGKSGARTLGWADADRIKLVSRPSTKLVIIHPIAAAKMVPYSCALIQCCLTLTAQGTNITIHHHMMLHTQVLFRCINFCM